MVRQSAQRGQDDLFLRLGETRIEVVVRLRVKQAAQCLDGRVGRMIRPSRSDDDRQRGDALPSAGASGTHSAADNDDVVGAVFFFFGRFTHLGLFPRYGCPRLDLISNWIFATL